MKVTQRTAVIVGGFAILLSSHCGGTEDSGGTGASSGEGPGGSAGVGGSSAGGSAGSGGAEGGSGGADATGAGGPGGASTGGGETGGSGAAMGGTGGSVGIAGSAGATGGSAGSLGSFVALCASSGVLFCDDFESGDLSHEEGGAKWGAATRVEVSDDRSVSGSHSARFLFEGKPSLAANADAFAELRFDLGALHSELWIQYELHIPANYVHRDAESSDNNKFFRLWALEYNEKEKVGASTWPNDDQSSRLAADWNNGGGVGPKGVWDKAFITSSDIDQWMNVKIQVRAATSSALGTLRIWKNGDLAIDCADQVDNFTEGEAHAYRRGYLLGWSNSGFTEETLLYIDNVIFSTNPL